MICSEDIIILLLATNSIACIIWCIFKHNQRFMMLLSAVMSAIAIILLIYMRFRF